MAAAAAAERGQGAPVVLREDLHAVVAAVRDEDALAARAPLDGHAGGVVQLVAARAALARHTERAHVHEAGREHLHAVVFVVRDVDSIAQRV